jgi:hypothetical protein
MRTGQLQCFRRFRLRCRAPRQSAAVETWVHRGPRGRRQGIRHGGSTRIREPSLDRRLSLANPDHPVASPASPGLGWFSVGKATAVKAIHGNPAVALQSWTRKPSCSVFGSHVPGSLRSSGCRCPRQADCVAVSLVLAAQESLLACQPGRSRPSAAEHSRRVGWSTGVRSVLTILVSRRLPERVARGLDSPTSLIRKSPREHSRFRRDWG